MSERKVIGYFRISGRDGALMRASLEEQRQALRGHVQASGMRLVEECVDYENGKRAARPQLARAISLCQAAGALLVIPRLGPLAKDPTVYIQLHVADIDVAALDVPQLSRASLLALGQAAHRDDIRRKADLAR